MILAYNCYLVPQSTNREEGASSLKMVDDFIARRQKQLLDTKIVTFNLKEVPVNREGCVIHQWNYGPPQSLRVWRRCQKEQERKKKLNYSFPWVEKLNKRAIRKPLSTESLKIFWNAPSNAQEWLVIWRLLNILWLLFTVCSNKKRLITSFLIKADNLLFLDNWCI